MVAEQYVSGTSLLNFVRPASPMTARKETGMHAEFQFN
jgi:hypothetical protein